MQVGSNLIRVVRGTQCSVNMHAHIQNTTEYCLDALPYPQLGATPLKFGPIQLEAGRQRDTWALHDAKLLVCLAL